MIDHIAIHVSDYGRAKTFYATVLVPLGYRLVMEVTKSGALEGAGFGDTNPYFWVGSGEVLKSQLHIAFAAKERKSVDAFYSAALAAGAKDNGAPGLRPHFRPNNYSAYAIDPDGHNIEAVCRDSLAVPGESQAPLPRIEILDLTNEVLGPKKARFCVDNAILRSAWMAAVFAAQRVARPTGPP